MTNYSVLRVLVILSLLFGVSGLAQADPPKDEKALAEEFRAFAKREASAYTIRLEGSDRPLTLQPEPVLKWSNPVVGTIYRRCFRLDRPRAAGGVASIYKYYSPPHPHRANEFHSLALGKLTAERDGAAVWTPSRPGLELTADPRRRRAGRLGPGTAPPDARAGAGVHRPPDQP